VCAGVTVSNALRHAGACAGEVVAVHGIGGLGPLGVPYARQMGVETIAINRGSDKEPLARQLGAHHDLDAIAQEAVTALQTLGGARLMLATAPTAPAMSALMDGLSPSGTLLVPAAPAQPLTISVLSLSSGRRALAG
jgi:propanol-preferring alcohol dehydrogenase